MLATSVLLSVSVFAHAGEKDEKETNTSVSTTNAVETVQLIASITDAKNNETLGGATVYVDGEKYYANLDGIFFMEGMKPGKHQLTVEFISYKSTIVDVDLSENETISINLDQN
jgi:hypothetical protein